MLQKGAPTIVRMSSPKETTLHLAKSFKISKGGKNYTAGRFQSINNTYFTYNYLIYNDIAYSDFTYNDSPNNEFTYNVFTYNGYLY